MYCPRRKPYGDVQVYPEIARGHSHVCLSNSDDLLNWSCNLCAHGKIYGWCGDESLWRYLIVVVEVSARLRHFEVCKSWWPLLSLIVTCYEVELSPMSM